MRAFWFASGLVVLLTIAAVAAIRRDRPEDNNLPEIAGLHASGEPSIALRIGGGERVFAETYAQLTDRPVFHAGRRMASPAPLVADTPPRPSRPQLTLVGVMLLPAGGKAYVRDGAGEPLGIGIGESVQGWTLRAIRAREIVLETTDEQWVLPIAGNGASMPAARQSDGPETPRTMRTTSSESR